jgi:hypothetical protein
MPVIPNPLLSFKARLLPFNKDRRHLSLSIAFYGLLAAFNLGSGVSPHLVDETKVTGDGLEMEMVLLLR